MRYAVSTARQNVNEHQKNIFQFEEAYADFLVKFGFQLFVLPMLADILVLEHLRPELILLPGGGDSPAEYYDSKVGVFPQNHRDDMEIKLMDFAVNNNIPVLGICRGMHMINGFLGGRLTRGEGHPVAVGHAVYTQGHGNIFGVNSFHRDVVRVEGLSQDLRAIAYHENGRHIEAFEGICHPILGLQWHPERMDGNFSGQNYSCRLISDFIAKNVKGDT